MKINIAIDGPSAAGKSTISDLLAYKYGYSHLDTGAMYRSIALKTILSGIDLNDETKIVEVINKTKLNILPDGRIFMDDNDISLDIRDHKISMAASDISKLSKVRESLVSMQQNITKDKGYIVDGRDIGTVVLKDAEIKFYLTAIAKKRAIRRMIQTKGGDYSDKDLENLSQEIEKRDHQDMNRENSPLKKADDAIIIDTTNLSINQTIDLMSKYINEKLKK